jgi:hypothetical protein
MFFFFGMDVLLSITIGFSIWETIVSTVAGALGIVA